MAEFQKAKFAVVTGATRISRLQAWTLSMAFALGLAVVPLIDLPGKVGEELVVAGKRAGGGIFQEWMSGRGWTGVNNLVEGELRAMEDLVAEHSFMAKQARPTLLEWLLEAGAGNENAYPGREGWLFFRPEVDYLTARSFGGASGSPEEAMATFAADLAERGIALMLVPTPGKPLIHPEMFAPGDWGEIPQSKDWENFRDRLAASIENEYRRRKLDGPIPVFVDPSELLWARKDNGPQFLNTDSHWTGEAVEAVAGLVAKHLGKLGIAPGNTPALTARRERVAGRGDTALMLGLPAGSRWNEEQVVEVQRVRMADGSAWRPGEASPVLLLGDSFTNIYSEDELGWGSGAGLAEQLSLRLGQAVDRISRNASGASATREMLASELTRNPERLEGKKVVVWQFAMRELVVGDWKVVPLPDGHVGGGGADAGDFLVLGPGESRTFKGRILAMGDLPVVGRTPYRDFLTAFHLEESEGSDQVVVYLQTLRDNEPTDAARLAPGQVISVEMSSWRDAEKTFGTMNRGDLEDGSLLLQEPNFGILEP